MLNSFKRNSSDSIYCEILISQKLGNYLKEEEKISIKNIKLSRINNRIKLNDFLLHYALENKCSSKLIKLLITKENLNVQNKDNEAPFTLLYIIKDQMKL